MKKIWLILLFLTPFISKAQFGNIQVPHNPVKWTTYAEKTGEKTYNLIFEADLENGWHLYSQFNDPMGSIPIEFEWKNAKDKKNPNGKYIVDGKAKESKTHKEYNETFKVTETFFTHHAKLTQPIKVIDSNIKNISVTLFGQACKESCIQIEKKNPHVSVADPKRIKDAKRI